MTTFLNKFDLQTQRSKKIDLINHVTLVTSGTTNNNTVARGPLAAYATDCVLLQMTGPGRKVRINRAKRDLERADRDCRDTPGIRGAPSCVGN